LAGQAPSLAELNSMVARMPPAVQVMFAQGVNDLLGRCLPLETVAVAAPPPVTPPPVTPVPVPGGPVVPVVPAPPAPAPAPTPAVVKVDDEEAVKGAAGDPWAAVTPLLETRLAPAVSGWVEHHKPGWATSEFHLAAGVVTAVLALPASGHPVPTAAQVLAVVVAAGYALLRSWLKTTT